MGVMRNKTARKANQVMMDTVYRRLKELVFKVRNSSSATSMCGLLLSLLRGSDFVDSSCASFAG